VNRARPKEDNRKETSVQNRDLARGKDEMEVRLKQLSSQGMCVPVCGCGPRYVVGFLTNLIWTRSGWRDGRLLTRFDPPLPSAHSHVPQHT
jgi:hypothetical protein